MLFFGFTGKHSSDDFKSTLLLEKLEEKEILYDRIPTEQVKSYPCEVLHLGFVCSGSSAILHFHVLLKSLYFYRVNPIHFHIITNKPFQNILQTLFDSWNVPQGKYLEY